MYIRAQQLYYSNFLVIPEHTNYRLYHFDQLNEQIYEVYNEHNLLNLSQVREGGELIWNRINDVMNRKENVHPLPFSSFKLQDEMDFITKDIKYVTGMLFFLSSYIVDTVEAGGRYNQNLEDRRYVMYANFGLQSIYNFWDRIGDALHLYFVTGISVHDVYLGRVLNNIRPEYKETSAYVALNDLYNNEIKSFLKDRNEAVHHYQLENRYYWGAIEHRRNKPEQDKLNAEKHALPETYKHHLALCIEGFKLAVDLLDTLPDKPVTVLETQVSSDTDAGLPSITQA